MTVTGAVTAGVDSTASATSAAAAGSSTSRAALPESGVGTERRTSAGTDGASASVGIKDANIQVE